MIDGSMASAVADAFSLGDAATLVGPVARGEVGQVWRLEAAAGVFAVKEPFHPTDDGWAEGFREAAVFQNTARSAGVHSPGVVRTQSGEVVAWFDRSPVRVYEWVDMAPADGAQQRVGEIASDHSADLRHLARGAEPIEAGR